MTEPRVLWNVRSPMRDGVGLANNVYLPPAGLAGGPYPVIFSRNPYNRMSWAEALRWRFFTEQGYAFVTQDCRGRFDSDGEFYPFFDDFEDGYDSVEWIAEQPWCTGKIGMMSGSYGGWTQWAAARGKPPHLTTLVSSCAAGKWGEELPWDRGGVSMVMFTWLYMTLRHSAQPTAHVDWARVFAHLPLRTMDKAMGVEIPAWNDWMDHPGLDDYWKQGRLDQDFADLDIPALHLTGWYDGDQPGEMFFWDGMLRSKAARSQHLLVGPWTHGGVFKPTQTQRDVDYTPASVADMDQVHLRWFDHWLKGIDTGILEGEPFRYVVPGSEGWRSSDAWPLPGQVHHAWALRADGGLDVQEGEAGSRTLLALGDGLNRPRASSTDPPAQLTWTSQPLTEDLEVIGDIELQLDATSTANDTAWIAFLQEVDVTGEAENVTAGYLRASLRRHEASSSRIGAPDLQCRHSEYVPLGEVVRYRVRLVANARRFSAGHRLQLVLCSDDQDEQAPAIFGFRHATVGTSSLNVVHSSSRLLLPT